jgi:hypothetical protein
MMGTQRLRELKAAEALRKRSSIAWQVAHGSLVIRTAEPGELPAPTQRKRPTPRERSRWLRDGHRETAPPDDDDDDNADNNND